MTENGGGGVCAAVAVRGVGGDTMCHLVVLATLVVGGVPQLCAVGGGDTLDCSGKMTERYLDFIKSSLGSSPQPASATGADPISCSLAMKCKNMVGPGGPARLGRRRLWGRTCSA